MEGLKGSDGRNRPRVVARMGSRRRGGPGPKVPEADMLAAHDAVATNSRRSPTEIGKAGQPGQACSPHSLVGSAAGHGTPFGTRRPLRGCETKAFAKDRSRSLQGAGANACLRARPTDSLRVIPAAEFVGMGRRFIWDRGARGGEVLQLRYNREVDTRHARICPRAGAQVNQHQPLL